MNRKICIPAVATLAISAALTGCFTTENTGVSGSTGSGNGKDTVWTTPEKLGEMGYEFKEFMLLGRKQKGFLQRVGNTWVYEGDIPVTLADGSVPALAKSAGNWDPTTVKWTNGIIPYKTDAGLSGAVALAVAEWNRRSGVKWVPFANITPAPANYVYFYMPSGNSNIGGYTTVGMQPGMNVVTVYAPGNKETIAHEMGHEMGLLHEHQRTDRDQYVSFFNGTSNAGSALCDPYYAWLDPISGTEIEGGNYFPGAYCKTEGEKLGVYDQNSIMHYKRKGWTTYCLMTHKEATFCSPIIDARLVEKSGAPSIAGAGLNVSFWDGHWVSVKYNTLGGADLVGIKRNANPTANTWIHKVSAAGVDITPFTTYNLQASVGMGVTQSSAVDYVMGDFNGDMVEDMIAIAKSVNGKTNVMVLSGATKFKTTLLINQPTAITQTNSGGWSFSAGDYNKDNRADLYLVNRWGARTDLHILDAATNYTTFLNQVPTALPQTGLDWDFTVGDFDLDGRADLYCIWKGAGATNSEAHIQSAASNFQSYVLQEVLPLHSVNANWNFKAKDFDRDTKPDLYCINRMGASGTEVHIASAASRLKTWIYQRVTALPQTNLTDWEIE